LQATLNRYRKTLQGLTQHKFPSTKRKVGGDRKLQDSALSQDLGSSVDLGGLKKKRPESGQSMISSGTNPPGLGGPGSIAATSVGGALDHDRIGRLLNLFQLLSKQKTPLDLIKTCLKELKNLV
jgi:hypothetical protein